MEAPPSDRAFDYAGFRLYWAARFLLVFAIQVLSVSVGWQIYDQTRDPFLLGLVGLVQFLPAPLLVPPIVLRLDTMRTPPPRARYGKSS